MAQRIKILVLEHDPDEIGLLQHELDKSELDYTLAIAVSRQAYQEALDSFQPDIILSDYTLPGFDGPSAFRLGQIAAPGTPFIMVSGTLGDDKAVALIKMGVSDYVLKENLYQVGAKIRRALQEAAGRRQNEAAVQQVKQQEQQLRKIMDLSLDIICTLDQNSRLVSISAAAKLLLDYRPEELVGQSMLALVHPDDREKTARALAGLQQGIDLVNLETRCRRKSGGLVSLLWSVRWDEDDNLGYGIAKDITDLKEAEKQVSINEKRFRTLLQNSTDGLILVGADDTVLERSLSALRILGFEGAREPTTFAFSLIHPDDVAAVRAALNQVKQTPHAVRKVVYRFRMPDDSYKWLETTLHNQLHEPAVRAVVLNFRDITESKLAEIALRTSEAKLKQAQAIGHMGSWEVSWDGGDDIWSDEMYRMFGVHKNAVRPSYKTMLTFIHPEDRPAFLKKMAEAQARQENGTTSFRIVRADGEVRYLRAQWCFEFNGGERPVRLFGILQDVTERRQAEEALEKSEAKYRTLFELSPVPMWVYDVDTLAFLDVNEATIRNYGYSKAEFLTMTLRDLRPQNERAELEALMARLKGSREHFHYIARHVRKGGEVIDVDIRNNFIELGGRETRLAIVTDISERMKYIQAVKTQNAQLRNIAWIQSHLVRAPLARLMGLVNLLVAGPAANATQTDILRYISASAHELDGIIRDIVRKAEQVQDQPVLEEHLE